MCESHFAANFSQPIKIMSTLYFKKLLFVEIPPSFRFSRQVNYFPPIIAIVLISLIRTQHT